MYRIFIFNLLLCLIPLVESHGQVASITTESLEGNNSIVKFATGGVHMFDHENSESSPFSIPAESELGPLFTSAYGVLGKDQNDSLRGGFPFYGINAYSPGPIGWENGEPVYDPENNEGYNRIYKVNRQEVKLHKNYYEYYGENGEFPTDLPFGNNYETPEVILNWPAHGDTTQGQAFYLAPFFDNDCCGGEEGVYEPELGDYPAFRFQDNASEFSCEEHIPGDVALYWIECDFNHNNNAQPSFLEFQNLAYMFAQQSGSLSNTVFHRTKVANRSGNDYTDVYLTRYEDFDLGCYNDDYVGSDVNRGMVYATNGTNSDNMCEGAEGYGSNPPSFGVDILKGPPANAEDGVDNDRDGQIDEPQETWIMNHSLSVSNSSIDHQNPQISAYRSAQSILYSGNHLLYGTTTEPGDPVGLEADMVWPYNSDPEGYSTGVPNLEPWSEWLVGNPSGDRRMFVSCGPFSLESGENFSTTTAYVYARDEADDELPFSLEALQQADDQVQEYFDNCFQDIPCATPTASIEYSAQENEFLFQSSYEANEYEWDFGDGSTEVTDVSAVEHFYSVPGTYTVCLTVSNECASNEVCEEITVIENPSFQMMDIQRIEGVGNGRHFLEFNQASKDSVLQNGEVVHPVYPGGSAPVQVFHEDGMEPEDGLYGVKFTGVTEDAHWKVFKYGEEDTITSQYTIGEGIVEYVEEYQVYVYINHMPFNTVGNSSPLPKALGYELNFGNSDINWLTGVQDNDLYSEENWIANGVLTSPGSGDNNTYGCLPDLSNETTYFYDQSPLDEEEQYEEVFNGIWSPLKYARSSPCLQVPGYPPAIPVERINDVDIILTPDRSKWTRSLVVNFERDPDLEGNNRYSARNALSVDKFGRNQNDPNCNTEEATLNGEQVNEAGMSYGMGWFPGYAIDLETGQRCNIIFAENPNDPQNNGNDMIWNPTAEAYDENGNTVFGGVHNIYIINNQEQIGPSAIDGDFDNGQYLYESFMGDVNIGETVISHSAMWTTIPLISEEFELTSMEDGLIPTETEIKLRIEQPYNKYLPTGQDTLNNRNPLYRFSPNGLLQSLSSTEEVSMDARLIAYPNPSSDQIMIKLPPGQSDGKVKVFDSRGRIVWSRSSKNSTIINIGVEEWDSGVYIIEYSTRNNTRFNSRVVVNR